MTLRSACRPRGSRLSAILLTTLLLSGCGDSMAMTPDGSLDDAMAPDGDLPDTTMPPVDGGVDGDVADADGGPPPVVFTETERAILATLSPLPAVPADPTNAVADDPDAADLGQRLFFDARFSGPLAVASDLGDVGEAGRVSCASCHSSSVLSDARSVPDNVSLGVSFHSRNAPALVNASFYPWTNWGGRFSAQWELPPVVAESPVIMNSSRLAIAHHLFDEYRTEYEALFGAMEPAIGTDSARFPLTGKPKSSPTAPDGPWELMTPEDRDVVNRIFIDFGKVIAAYLRLLVSGDAPFDRFVAGEDDAISESAKRGLRLFIGPARCLSCHSGPTLSDGAFHNIGVAQIGDHVPASDDGRWKDVPGLLSSPFNSAGAFSDDAAFGMARLAGLTIPPPESARGAFRTPTLRNVTQSAPYMHSGQMATLEEVIEHYDMGGDVPVSGTLDSLMLPLGLSDQDVSDLLELLGAFESDPIDASLTTP